MTNPIRRLTAKELLLTLNRLFVENSENKNILQTMLQEGTDDIELMAAIVKEFSRRDAKQELQPNYLCNIIFNAKLDDYPTTTATDSEV
ncbi:MAG: hypothetical protein LBC03_00785 [Nitrososphaerota archaeon]|nr:hypothetical protein [Nitrososphaerota archaeon]